MVMLTDALIPLLPFTAFLTIGLSGETVPAIAPMTEAMTGP